jgi:hypothetical protein
LGERKALPRLRKIAGFDRGQETGQRGQWRQFLAAELPDDDPS